MKGATRLPNFLSGAIHNFNPRTREGCDSLREPDYTFDADISIHAPVKGATYYGEKTQEQIDISIHAPVKGATRSHGLQADH